MSLICKCPFQCVPLLRRGAWCLWLSALAPGLSAGCELVPGGMPPAGNNGDASTVTATIVNVTTNFGVSALGVPIAVVYTVTGTPDSVEGFYVPVGDDRPDAGPVGERVISASNLSAGSDKAFNFDPQEVGIGFYRVGVVVTTGETEIVAQSQAVIRVEGLPNPTIVQPTGPSCVGGVSAGVICRMDDAAACPGQCAGGADEGESCLVNGDCASPGTCQSRGTCRPDLSVIVGTKVTVSFDAGDPEGVVQWRLFFLDSTDSRDASPDQLGTEIAVGAGNTGQATFDTTDLTPGDYELGFSATDSGSSVSSTAVSGHVERIVTIPNDMRSGPVVRVVAP